MRHDRDQALKLRLQGKSYTEIGRQLGVAKSTLSGWFSQLILPDAVRSRMMKRTNKGALAALLARNVAQTGLAQKRAAAIRQNSRSSIKSLSQRELYLVGLTLYWAEGYKRTMVRSGRPVTYHAVSLVNADPHVIRLFLAFLRRCLHVPEDRLRVSVRMFAHQNEAQLRTYWAEVADFPESRMTLARVTTNLSSQGKRPFNRLPYGVANVRVNDSQLFHRIMGALEGLQSLRYTDGRSDGTDQFDNLPE